MTKNNKTNLIVLVLALALAFATLASFANAQVYVSDVSQTSLYPGEEASIDIKIANDFNYDVEDISLNLVFANSNGQVLFTPVGSSSDSVDEIKDDDDESFSFKIKASNSIAPGDYVLGYVLTYNNLTTPVEGTIGVTVNSKTALDFSVKQDTKVIGMNDRITLTIYNKGYGDVKFVIVDVDVSNAVLLSEAKSYIGNIASDDFQTASYNVLLNKANPSVSFTISYKDFENNDKTEVLNYDLTAYTKEKALELGLIKKSNTGLIVSIIIVLAIVWFIVRAVKKARARKEKLKNNSIR